MLSSHKSNILEVLKRVKRFERKLEEIFARSFEANSQADPVIGFDKYLEDKRGRALISYLSAPFRISHESSQMFSHQNVCRALEIAKVFNKLGYIVDVVDLYDHTFRPRYGYDILFGNGTNFRRLGRILGQKVLKIFFTPDPHPNFRRKAEKIRRDDIVKRRGVQLVLRYPRAIEFPEKYVDAVICTGNSWVASQFAVFNRHVYPTGDGGFDNLRSTIFGKEFIVARTHFMWMANWLFVAKGLDLVLETFSKLPNINLHICGALWNEPDVIDAYEKELFHQRNIHFLGKMDLSSSDFEELTRRCAYTIFPSSGDTAAGSVWAPMRCGVIPIVSVENGMDTDDFGITLSDCKLDTIREAVINAANTDPEKCKAMAERAALMGNTYYTLDSWSERFEKALVAIIKDR